MLTYCLSKLPPSGEQSSFFRMVAVGPFNVECEINALF